MRRGTSGALRRGGAVVVGTALVLGAVGCSDDAAPESKRACAVLQAGELSDLTGVKLTLEKAEEGSRVCRFVNVDGTFEIETLLEGPVEAGLAELILTDPAEVEGIGDEAWYATRDVPLDSRMVVRSGGALFTIDLEASRLSSRKRKAMLTDVAEAAVPEIPKMKVKKAAGERGDDACERYRGKDTSSAMGGVPAVTSSLPPGACVLTLEQTGLTVTVSPLIERNATEAQLEAFVRNVDEREPTTVGAEAKAPAYWLPSPAGAEVGGQLDVLDEDRIIQVAVSGDGLREGEAKDIASGVAIVAIA